MDDELKNVIAGYRNKLWELCRTEPIARRYFDIATSLNMSKEDAAVLIAVHALECLKATQQELSVALMELPPDAFYVKDETGKRSLVRYTGPTIQELRAQKTKT